MAARTLATQALHVKGIRPHALDIAAAGVNDERRGVRDDVLLPQLHLACV